MTPFFFVDVFAERPLTGNPLALVPDADGLTVDQMRDIAREFNQSETTFLLQPTRPGAAWRLRSFTPIGAEVDGAGHNALGAWLWLADQGLTGEGPSRTLMQEIGDDVLPVEVVRPHGEGVRVVMEQSSPVFGPSVEDSRRLAAALGLRPEELRTDAPAQAVSTGVSHLLVPLVDRPSVDGTAVDSRALAAILAEVGAEGCYVYTTAPGDPEADAYSRFFNPTVGIVEDPATGTAAGPLAALLARTRGIDAGLIIIEQGHKLGRPSRIQVEIDGDRVRISGSGIVTGRGELRLA
ncbi:PhzF family phenazine biosynthesis isomerase [Nonomuraea phyllanthi]|uniref:PhzF family phenazine biosynthesis isomerase n=1 Tax=Nonomuraea phyllanthi TaxID=2219224 RepID=A0A5C4WU60_9ACTN|nr:PhzF family phenazine biosynthesis protein [Nonomuraea phyllanthi]KAB8196835.1 PhzF family phenazine biosynthesis isomerase [Nonomuraea phyllanthi]